MGIRVRLQRASSAFFYVLLVALCLVMAWGCDDSDNSKDPACGNGGEPCEAVRGCTDPTALNYNASATEDDGNCTKVYSSPFFMEYAKPNTVPGKFPTSACDTVTTHHDCVSTSGCNWLRTIKDNGVCREDPVNRCITSGECICRAYDFHGETEHENDLEIFLPISIVSKNLAPQTSTTGSTPTSQYTTTIEMAELENESLDNYTSRTDFTHKTLTVRAKSEADITGITDAQGISLTMKFMHVWDTTPATMGGTLFEGLGMQVVLNDDQLSIVVGDTTYPIQGETDGNGKVKNYQCNQLAIVVANNTDAAVYLGGELTTLAGLTLNFLKTQMSSAAEPLQAMRIGAINAKVWDVRLYDNNRLLNAAEVTTIGKRCGTVGQYRIPSGYPESNRRYSWGMGGYDIVTNHTTQHFASGVYATMWIPEEDTFPPIDPVYRDNLQRMIGFWDRWHEQMFFELDFIPYVDTRKLSPQGSLNSYRNYTEESNLCSNPQNCGEPLNYNNPCKYVTDLFQAFNWLPEDFPGEPTSADHRRIAENGGFTRWDAYDSDIYSNWQRPVHEHGHAAHFTLMRTYKKLHHYIRGISGESFASIMAYYLFAGSKSWMNTALTYYPTIPLPFEGRWDSGTKTHVLKSPQPYQGKNIDDLGLGARFYGLNVWWTFVSHYAAKPYLIGRIAADTDQTPGTTLQKMRFYLAQENLDLGELFGNYAAHVATWDWPHLGHNYYEQEQDPFKGIERWCTTNSGASCTIDDLKVQASLNADVGTAGEWVDGPPLVQPGGFAYNTIRIGSAPGGSLFKIGLDFEVPTYLYRNASYSIAINPQCKEDPRFFSSRIVVVDEGTEGQKTRVNRPHYYKIPGRRVEDVIIQVPEGRTSTIYLLAIPTPPFELEDVPGFVDGYSLLWPFKYNVERLSSLPAGASKKEPIILDGDEMLSLEPQTGNGFTYDCFYDPGLQARQDTLDECIAFCASSGFRNSDTDESCNQQLSCRNACTIKFDVATTEECEGHCDRTDGDGCYLMLAGRDYNMCGACVGDENNGLAAECTLGCNFKTESE